MIFHRNFYWIKMTITILYQSDNNVNDEIYNTLLWKFKDYAIKKFSKVGKFSTSGDIILGSHDTNNKCLCFDNTIVKIQGIAKLLDVGLIIETDTTYFIVWETLSNQKTNQVIWDKTDFGIIYDEITNFILKGTNIELNIIKPNGRHGKFKGKNVRYICRPNSVSCHIL